MAFCLSSAGYVQQLTVFIAEKLESAPGIQYRRYSSKNIHKHSALEIQK